MRYVWPAVPGPVKRGVPTGFGAAPLAGNISAAAGEAPVWAPASGSAKGPSLSLIYRTAPQAALAGLRLHRLLALLDALRAGRARERALAAELCQRSWRQRMRRDDPNLPYLRLVAVAPRCNNDRPDPGPNRPRPQQ